MRLPKQLRQELMRRGECFWADERVLPLPAGLREGGRRGCGLGWGGAQASSRPASRTYR